MNWNLIIPLLRLPHPWTLRVRHFKELSSTQDVPLEGVLGENEIVLIIAEIQKSGRGRGDRTWESLLGNFHGTLIVKRPETLLFPITTLSLLSGAALANSIERFVSFPHKIKLKWPNDVLINEKKCAGILCSTKGNELRIGMGVNLTQAPPVKGPRQSLALTEVSRNFQAGEWLQEFLFQWWHFYDDWTNGFDHGWRESWNKFGEFGKSVTLTDGESLIPVGIGPAGELLVNENSGGSVEVRRLNLEEIV